MINEFEDYYYGYMVPDASYLPYFDLHLYEGGFVIQMPEADAPAPAADGRSELQSSGRTAPLPETSGYSC